MALLYSVQPIAARDRKPPMMEGDRSLQKDSDGRKLPVAGDPTSRVALTVLAAAIIVAGVLVAQLGRVEVSRPSVQPQTQSGPPAAQADASQPAQAQDDRRLAAAEPAIPSEDIELMLWESASTSNDPTLLERYLAAYPAGRYADAAREKLVEARAHRRQAPPMGNASDDASAKTSPPPPTPVVAAAPPAPAPTPVVAAPPAPPPIVAPPTPPPVQVVAATPPAASPVPAAPDNGELARALQRELKRVGCLSGEPDGVWGEQSRSALKKFVKHAKLAVESDAPNAAVLDAAAAARDRVCPLVCDEGEHVVNGRCVENARPAREHTRKAESRSGPAQRERPRREYDAPARSGGGGSGGGGGSKLCFGPERGGPLVACK
jgi:hypothetical protein